MKHFDVLGNHFSIIAAPRLQTFASAPRAVMDPATAAGGPDAP
jgi:hypothetical protein